MAWTWLQDGTPLHSLEAGSGRPLVLLHALMYSARWFWRPNLGALSQGAHVHALDMRGQGESGKPNRGYTIPGLADDLREFLEAKAIDGAVVVGVALGGLVLLDYLKRFGPKRIAGVAIVDMTPRLVSAEGWAHPTFGEFPQAAADAFGAQVRKDRSGLRGFLAAGTANPLPEETLDEMVAEAFLTPTDVIAELVDDMVKQDFRAFLPKIPVPTLLMYGGPKNKILPTGVGRWMATQIPNSRLVEFAESGHMPFLEEPEKFNAELLRFVRELR
jgi:pimeloyl-ACP methyl ester carboxylesterase